MDFKGLSNAVTNTPSLLPSMGITRRKMVLAQSSTNGPRLLSHPKTSTHSPLLKKSHTMAHTPKQGGISDGGGITTLGPFRTFTNIPGPGVRTAYFAAFGSWSGGAPKERREPRDSDAHKRIAVPRRRGPAGLRDLFRFCRNLWLYAPRSVLSECARRGVVSLPSVCSACC